MSQPMLGDLLKMLCALVPFPLDFIGRVLV